MTTEGRQLDLTELPPIRSDIALAKADLDIYGMARLRCAEVSNEIEDLRTRTMDQANAEDARGWSYRDDGALPSPFGANQRVWNLINKGEIFRRTVLNPVALELVRHLLGKDILLFSMTANIAARGAKAQPLHGDQLFAPAETPYPLITNCLWMLDEFTAENGATRVVPSSHTKGRWPKEGEDIVTLPATGLAGTIMVWDGRLWHGTGANTTDKPRAGLLVAYCKPFLRQQENHTLSTSPEVLSQASPELLTLLGFRNWYGLGMVDGSSHGKISQRPLTFSSELRSNS